jgi:hypothetical protein
MAEKSGLHRRASIPTTFYVRPKRDGWCVYMEGRESPLSKHYTQEGAIALAESLARSTNSRVSLSDLERKTG